MTAQTKADRTSRKHRGSVGDRRILQGGGRIAGSHRTRRPAGRGRFLTDGVVNLAILHFKSDEAAQGTGKDFVGIHHIGFWVDDVVEQGKIARNSGATWIMGDPSNPDGYEVKHTDLSGIIFDIAAHGWAGSQKNPGDEDDIVHPNPQRRGEVRAARRAREDCIDAGPGDSRRGGVKVRGFAP